jgi:hypothetical protein
MTRLRRDKSPARPASRREGAKGQDPIFRKGPEAAIARLVFGRNFNFPDFRPGGRARTPGQGLETEGG